MSQIIEITLIIQYYSLQQKYKFTKTLTLK